ncbi:hypothetical protein [Clostridium sp. HV4-5-A1G]|uniref:hypothetical protein n=1 Tax=Clostridium sp. HV4-5-A1G TaxID=2004595 RepID=UPI001238BD16|nr:hypothetical protein [Clostridium sp. HV4-5-A1G]KAA8676170.1 hypothetical protein F3O63_03595 [Clostridium sp. HV4-5-A1G]
MVLGGRRMVFENLMALWIAIEKECPQEVAFKYLDRYLGDGPKQAPKFRWTPQDVEDVMKFRKEGINCAEIGSYYGLKGASISYLLCRKRKEVSARA